MIGSVIFLLAFLALAAYMRRRRRSRPPDTSRRPETRYSDSKTEEVSSRLSPIGELQNRERLPELHPNATQEAPAGAIHQLE